MTAQTSRWFEYGEPTGSGRVEARIRTTYQTGPNEQTRDDDIEFGTVSFDALGLLDTDAEISSHQHDDGSVLLSALSDDAERRLLDTFEADDTLVQLIRHGCTPPEAVDYLLVEERGWSQTAWADVRGVGQGSVSENVSKARDKLETHA